MYISKLPFKTIKSVDDDSLTDSQRLLIRSGVVRKQERNHYMLLPFGQRVINHITKYICCNLESNKYVEVDTIGQDDFVKSVSKLISSDLKSYKDLPQGYYENGVYERTSFQTKDKLLDGKKFSGIRCIKYYKTKEECENGVVNISQGLSTYLNKLGINNEIVHNYNEIMPSEESVGIAIDRKSSNKIYKCNKCGYNIAREIVSNDKEIDIEYNETEEIEPILTENIKTIDELTEFLGVEKTDLAKTLLLKVESELIAVVIRGDRELNLSKLSKYLNIHRDCIDMATNEEIETQIDTVVGFVGPVELHNIRILIDKEVAKGSYITGANKKDYHIKNVTFLRDFHSDMIGDFIYSDLDKCSNCKEVLTEKEYMYIININSLGKIEYPRSFNYKDIDGKTKDVYGLYFEIDTLRILGLVADKNRDESGLIWPREVTPFDALITIMNVKKEEQLELAKTIYNNLKSEIVPLVDDRNERAGAKFFDSELWGIPIRITIGKKASEGIVEVKYRNESEKKEMNIEDAIELIKKYYSKI